MRHYLLFITRGARAGQTIPATEAMIEKARADGYGMRPGVDGPPPRGDRAPHAAGDAFAAAYADRQLRAAMYAGLDPMTVARVALKAGQSGHFAGQEPEGGKRPRGRPRKAQGGP